MTSGFFSWKASAAALLTAAPVGTIGTMAPNETTTNSQASAPNSAITRRHRPTRVRCGGGRAHDQGLALVQDPHLAVRGGPGRVPGELLARAAEHVLADPAHADRPERAVVHRHRPGRLHPAQRLGGVHRVEVAVRAERRAPAADRDQRQVQRGEVGHLVEQAGVARVPGPGIALHHEAERGRLQLGPRRPAARVCGLHRTDPDRADGGLLARHQLDAALAGRAAQAARDQAGRSARHDEQRFAGHGAQRRQMEMVGVQMRQQYGVRRARQRRECRRPCAAGGSAGR